MENGFQVAKFLFEVQKTSNLFCFGQNGPVVVWVAVLALKGVLGVPEEVKRAFQRPFGPSAQKALKRTFHYLGPPRSPFKGNTGKLNHN